MRIAPARAPKWSGHLWLVVDDGVELAGTGHLDPVPLTRNQVTALVGAATGSDVLDQKEPELRAALARRSWEPAPTARPMGRGPAGPVPRDVRPALVCVDAAGPWAYDHRQRQMVAVGMEDLLAEVGEGPEDGAPSSMPDAEVSPPATDDLPAPGPADAGDDLAAPELVDPPTALAPEGPLSPSDAGAGRAPRRWWRRLRGGGTGPAMHDAPDSGGDGGTAVAGGSGTPVAIRPTRGLAAAPTALPRDEAGSSPTGAVPKATTEAATQPRAEPPSHGPVPVWFGTCSGGADGNPLALGMVRSAIVHHDEGRLEGDYEVGSIRVSAADLLDDARAGGRPGVLFMSNYLWTIDQNLAVAAEIKELHPETLVVFGGPSAPKYPGDAAAFLEAHPQVDVLARGEGEQTAPNLLVALDGDLRSWQDRLLEVPNLTLRGIDGAVRTVDGERLTDLDAVPSPYLTGMFDHLVDHGGIWTVETNRGCPYGCTFCDWGSATLSRVRKYSMERIVAELEWLATHDIGAVFFADANFGMYKRDLEIAERLAELKRTYGAPHSMIATWAKNTTKYSLPIIAALRSAGVNAEVVMSFQTIDEQTLVNIDRKNLLTSIYPDMARQAAQGALPLISEFMLGLPGSTMDSLRNDVQLVIEAGTSARFFGTVLLPNSPMNDPEYRELHEIVVDDRMQVISTASFTEADREDMIQFLDLFRAADHYGVLREVISFTAHEASVREVDVLWELYLAGLEESGRYPLLGWFVSSFRRYRTVPMGWEPFLSEVARALVGRGMVEDGDDLRTVLAVQEALLPAPARSFPEPIEMRHDVAAYRSQDAIGPERRPLRSFGPGTMVVDDPDGLTATAFATMHDLAFSGTGSRLMIDNGVFWGGEHWELDAPLSRALRAMYL